MVLTNGFSPVQVYQDGPFTGGNLLDIVGEGPLDLEDVEVYNATTRVSRTYHTHTCIAHVYNIRTTRVTFATCRLLLLYMLTHYILLIIHE